ncbi:MAG: response regulator transcription factor [Acidobacteria bacterium]|nr:response regulator transcription factor [Acidobacteriota bacterium]
MKVNHKVKVLLCDDHTLFREGIRAILERDPSIEVIGEAQDGKQAVDMALRLHPNVVLMDIAMPMLIGYEATKRITQAGENIKVLILTMYDEEDTIRLCLNAGASGYILKDAPVSTLIEGIHAVHEGNSVLSPEVLTQVVQEYVAASGPQKTRYDTLTEREKEILKLLADGLSVKQIATVLGISVKTVEAHKYNLMKKLDLHDRTALLRYALRTRLVQSPL